MIGSGTQVIFDVVNGLPVQVEGCVTIQGSVVVILSQEQLPQWNVFTSGQEELNVLSSTCPISLFQEAFQLQVAQNRTCQEIAGSLSTSGTSLSVLLNMSPKKACRNGIYLAFNQSIK